MTTSTDVVHSLEIYLYMGLFDGEREEIPFYPGMITTQDLSTFIEIYEVDPQKKDGPKKLLAAFKEKNMDGKGEIITLDSESFLGSLLPLSVTGTELIMLVKAILNEKNYLSCAHFTHSNDAKWHAGVAVHLSTKNVYSAIKCLWQHFALEWRENHWRVSIIYPKNKGVGIGERGVALYKPGRGEKFVHPADGGMNSLPVPVMRVGQQSARAASRLFNFLKERAVPGEDGRLHVNLLGSELQEAIAKEEKAFAKQHGTSKKS